MCSDTLQSAFRPISVPNGDAKAVYMSRHSSGSHSTSSIGGYSNSSSSSSASITPGPFEAGLHPAPTHPTSDPTRQRAHSTIQEVLFEWALPLLVVLLLTAKLYQRFHPEGSL